MHIQRVTCIFVLILVALLALLPLQAVFAEQPDFIPVSVDDTHPIEPQLCPGIVIMDHEVFTTKGMLMYDNQGNLVKVRVSVQGEDSLYNADNPSFVLSGKWAGTQLLNPDTFPESIDVIRQTGLAWHLTFPGDGAVLMASGLWAGFPNVHLAGKDSFVDPKDLAQFCSLMS